MNKLSLAGLCLVVLVIGCRHKSDKLRVENKLGKNIVCVLSYDYPDTKLDFVKKQELVTDTVLFAVDTNQTKEIDTTSGLCKQDVWNKYVKQSLLMLLVFDKDKLIHAKKLDDAFIERYYFSYTQLLRDKGVVVVF